MKELASGLKVVVVIPAFNEERTISVLIKKIKSSLKNFPHRVLVLDDGSTDRTRECALKAGALVISHKHNLGLAEAFRSEIAEALKLGADVIVQMDADLQHDPAEILLLLNEIRAGNDLVLGSRFLLETPPMPLLKRLGNKAFSWVVSHMIRQKITDSQSGFRAFTREVAGLKLRNTYTYTQEQILLAAKKGFTVKEVPITVGVRKGKSRLISSPFAYAVNAGINILRTYRDFAPLKFFGSLGLVLFFVGLIFGFYLSYLHLTQPVTGHIALIILTALLIIGGIQVMLFGFMADMRK